MQFGAKWINIYQVYRRARRLLANIIQRQEVNWFDLKANLVQIPWIEDRFVDDADVVVATAWPTAFSVNKLSESKGKKFYPAL